jgi:hypothetical protein
MKHPEVTKILFRVLQKDMFAIKLEQAGNGLVVRVSCSLLFLLRRFCVAEVSDGHPLILVIKSASTEMCMPCC